MSWDCSLYRFKNAQVPKADACDEEFEFESESLGSYQAVKDLLNKALSLHWDDTGWAVLDSPDFTVEFNLDSTASDIRSITLHVHEPHFALHAVKELCDGVKLSVFDDQEGRFIDLARLEFASIEDGLEELEPDEEEDYSETIRRPQLIAIHYLD